MSADTVVRVFNAAAVSTNQINNKSVVAHHVGNDGVSQLASITRVDERGHSGARFQCRGSEY